MRSVLHLNKLIAVSCIIFFILLNSCHPKITGLSLASAIAPEVIQIVDGDSTSGKLVMQDVYGNSADTFQINPGEHLTWLLGHNQMITRITNIYQKPTTSQNVFSVYPDSTGGSSLNWQATIDSGASGKTEDYNIDWIDKNGLPHTFDPKIQVR